MRSIVVLVVALLVPLPAWAAGEWFAIAYQLEGKTREVDIGKGMTNSDCLKRQIEIETKVPWWTVRCSRMTQKIRSENQDGDLDSTYLISWKADTVLFTQMKSLALCQQKKAELAQPQNGRADLFVCAQSYQRIK
jgi:hypothetical protein